MFRWEIINLIQSNNLLEAKNKIYYLLDSNQKNINLFFKILYICRTISILKTKLNETQN